VAVGGRRRNAAGNRGSRSLIAGFYGCMLHANCPACPQIRKLSRLARRAAAPGGRPAVMALMPRLVRFPYITRVTGRRCHSIFGAEHGADKPAAAAALARLLQQCRDLGQPANTDLVGQAAQMMVCCCTAATAFLTGCLSVL
jgi:hypothetical protein